MKNLLWNRKFPWMKCSWH